MTDETYNILSDFCNEKNRDELDEAFDAADNEGYVQDDYSNNPTELISYIIGYLAAKSLYNGK